MHLLIYRLTAILFMNITTATAAAFPQLDDGLAAQPSGFQNAVFTSPPQSLPAIKTPHPQTSATSPMPQDNSLEAQSPAAINRVFDSAANTTATNIPTANQNAAPSATQDNGLEVQDINPVDIAFSAQDNSTMKTDPQPVNESIVPVTRQKGGLVPQQDDDGQQAPGNGTRIDYGPAPTLNPTPFPPHAPAASTIPSASTSASASNPTASPIPQDNGLQAQDSGSANTDFNPVDNTTSVNYPHEVHRADGTLMVAAVQDNGLQAQDSGGANMVWAPGEVYGGGEGGEINVPTVTDGGLVDQKL